MSPETTWSCPLCPWSAERSAVDAILEHGTSQHPATLPRNLTVAQRLRIIPALAAEVVATIGAPNPNGEEVQVAFRREHPPLPISTASLDVLAPEDGNRPWRMLTRLVECTRIVRDALDDETREAHPLPDGEPSFRGDANWISEVWDEAQVSLDLADMDWIDGTTADVASALASVANLAVEVRYSCPTCGEAMHLGLGDWMICETGQHQHPGPVRLRDQWRRRPPMSTNHLAAELHITTERIRKWAERGKIEPQRYEGRTAFWLPWDVVGCLYPDIVAEIGHAEEVASLTA